MYGHFETWLDDVENIVFVHFGEDLDFFIQTYGLVIEDMYNSLMGPEEVLEHIQSMLEGDEYIPDDVYDSDDNFNDRY